MLGDELAIVEEEIDPRRELELIPRGVERGLLVGGRFGRLDQHEIPARAVAVHIKLARRQTGHPVGLVIFGDRLEEGFMLARGNPVDLDDDLLDGRRGGGLCQGGRGEAYGEGAE